VLIALTFSPLTATAQDQNAPGQPALVVRPDNISLAAVIVPPSTLRATTIEGPDGLHDLLVAGPRGDGIDQVTLAIALSYDPDLYEAPPELPPGHVPGDPFELTINLGHTQTYTFAPKPPPPAADGDPSDPSDPNYEDRRPPQAQAIHIYAADYRLLINNTPSSTMDRAQAKEEDAEKDDLIYLLPNQPADPDAAPPDAATLPQPFTATLEADIRSPIDLTLDLATPQDPPHIQFADDTLTGKTASNPTTTITPLLPSPEEDGTTIMATHSLTGSSGEEDLTVRTLTLSISSIKANIEPSRHGTPDEPYQCNNPSHVAAGEVIIDALTIYHNAVRDEEGKTQPFDVILETEDIANLEWTVGPGPASGELIDATSSTAIFRNPTRGGLYEFHATIGGSFTFGKLQLWLPVAGPDISQYWETEIAYFTDTWGPQYRAKLFQRTILFVGNPPAHFVAMRNMAILDMLDLGGGLDWNNPGDHILSGVATPCGGPTTFWAPYFDETKKIPLQTLTLSGFVTSWPKRNNMMYALIGREMGILSRTLINSGHIVNYVTSQTHDSAAAVTSYRAGFDLHKGIGLANVMGERGLNMQEPDSWAQREWPSHEHTDSALVRQRADALNRLLK
jgi:hypothetical protein